MRPFIVAVLLVNFVRTLQGFSIATDWLYKIDWSKRWNDPEIWALWKRVYQPYTKDEFRTSLLEFHNYYRAVHGSPNLKLNQTLNNGAQKWAEWLAEKDKFDHSPVQSVGENLYSGYYVTVTEVVKGWYDEIKKYRYTQPRFSIYTGHFTQVIWNATEQLGVGFAQSRIKPGKYFVVAHYYPPGNIPSQFKQNVFPRQN